MTDPTRIPRLRPAGSNTQAWLRRGIIALVVVLFFGRAVATGLTNWLWYRDVGFERVFLTMFAAQWVMGLIAGVGAFVLLYVSARAALRGAATKNLHIRDAQQWAAEGPQVLVERMAIVLAPLVSLGLAIIVGLASAGNWRDLAQFFYRTPFGVTDPIFGRDVAYYVFTIPMMQHALTFASAIGWLALIMALVIYVARSDVGLAAGAGREPWRAFVTPRAQTHLAVLGAALLVVSSIRVLLVAAPMLLLGRHTVLFGATYADLKVQMPLFYLQAGVLVAGAGLLLWYARSGRIVRGAIIVVAAVVASQLLLGGVVPATFQRLVVQPNELARETQQIAHHITATRAAWGLDGVDRRELATDKPLTPRDIQNNQVTIKNVRLWDREPLLQTYGQLQAIRTYYDFVSVDDDRYIVNGELRQVLLAPRELNTASLPTRTFINEHLTYTHGMGVALGPSNQVTQEGLPLLLVKDLPPVSSVPTIKITRPQIYFGELSNDFIMAPTRQKEFDYPSGEGDAAVYSTYDGGAGVRIGSFARRLLFAFRFGALNILLSGDLTDATRILFYRDVLERAERALPFLTFDQDPFMVITNDGRLEWMLDAYTVTSRYPYSQPLANGTNYMRNSVKVMIDAYTGATRAYLADPADPMIRTLGRIYPGLLRPMSEMPADLRSHVRYPGTLFAAQSALYATFHMTNAETFYHREDQWQIPSSGRVAAEAFMRHIVMRLPGEKEPEFILMRPFTPRQKDNLAAWMVVRNDGDHYGKLVVYTFPRQSLVFGPAQIVNRINQDTEVAQQISLWDQRGSEVIRGELLVIPIEQSLIYVQPLYLRAQGGKIPELKRVVVAHESRVAMEETLEAGLARLFGGGTVAAAAPGVAQVQAPAPAGETGAAETARLLREAQQAFDRSSAALRAGDFATYGAEQKRLGEILRQLNARRP